MNNYTVKEYVGFAEAFEFFNAELFDGSLPDLLITLGSGSSFRGQYGASKFISRNDGGDVASELKLNTDTFIDRFDMDILSTFVHELVHHQQHHQGRPSRGNYHNKEFSKMMEEVGLHTTKDGTWEGKRIGSGMTHLIIPGGKFEQAAQKFLSENNFKIGWESKPKNRSKSLDPSKVKFVCNCNPAQAVWGKIFSVPICPLCASVFTWAKPDEVKAWIKEQVEKNVEFQEAVTKYEQDLELAQSMIESALESGD